MSSNDPAQQGESGDRRQAALARSLAQLTSGWSPIAGVAPEALPAARAALASSVLAGMEAADLHASRLPLRIVHATPVDPPLHAELTRIAQGAIDAKTTATIAAVRSATAVDINNPSGAPSWARAGRVLQSYGPFRDAQGVLHWVDLLSVTRSIPFAFGSSATPFGVFPVHTRIIVPPHPTRLKLDAGSAWFLANLLAPAIPAGTFTGFTITGGELIASAPMTLSGGTYVIPAGETLTAQFSLAPAPAPGPSGTAGADAAAARFTPPAQVTIDFTQGSAEFTRIDDFSASAYGTDVALRWNESAPAQVATLPLLVVPCDPTPQSFTFASVVSTLFAPFGTARITLAGWGLPLATTSIATLPDAGGPGSGVVEFGKGVSVAVPIEPQPVAVREGLLEIFTGGLFEVFAGNARPATTVYQLWPLPAPASRNATFEFATRANFAFAFLASPHDELFLSTGLATSHLDRPRTASGALVPFSAQATLLLTHTDALDSLFLLAVHTDDRRTIFPLALENCALGVDAPAVLVISGKLQGEAMQNAAIGLFYNLRWLLPTLPDPYAANFDLSAIPAQLPPTIGTLLATIGWAGATNEPTLGFLWLPPPQGGTVAATPFPSSIQIRGDTPFALASRSAAPALLDLSTRVDLFGVALAPAMGQLALSTEDRYRRQSTVETAPAVALTGMSLSLNSGLIATFALPQSSWEPMESTAQPAGPIFCEPASDGFPLLVSAPDVQRLVPFSPGPVLTSNIENVAGGHPFAALFSLPFGLNALIIEPNRPVHGRIPTLRSQFLLDGGVFRENRPHFVASFVPKPPPDASKLRGALQLTLKPTHPERPAAMFQGFTDLDTTHGPFIGPTPNGYGYAVIGAVSGVGKMFHDQFAGGKSHGVPLRRIDFSGYGASIFSEWDQPDRTVGIIKVEFQTSIGRTGHEVIQAVSVIYPYCIHVVRTVTMGRQNAGWVRRTDSGWQAASPGQFQFPPDIAPQWVSRVHSGAFAGAFNVRNIRDQPDVIKIAPDYEFRKVLFDADLGVDSSLNVVNGGFTAAVTGVANPPVLTASRDLVGWVQVAPPVPPGNSPSPAVLSALFAQTGVFTPGIACAVEAGAANGIAGTTLRCSAFEVSMIEASNSGAPVPALGAALRGAPQIPRGGGWSLGRRGFADPAPSALPGDFPLPLVQPAGAPGTWFLADVRDVLQLTQPDSFYSLMHATGTQKILFEAPEIPVGAAKPGLQFAKPGAAKPGGAPPNPGAPNLGDIASILNSTGLFPDIGNAVSLMQAALEQIDTIAQGLKYSKTFTFDPNQKVTLIDIGIINVTLQYADTGMATLAGAQQPPVGIAPPPAKITYTVDSSASPSWTLAVGPLSFLVTVPLFGTTPILTITGGFYADEHTKAGLTGLNVQMGDALSMVKQVFSALQTVAQYLPGGGGAQLDVALSNGKLTVRENFSIARLPLGVGNLTDVSLGLGLAVSLQPLSVDFSVGIGSPSHPFNWIVSPLAGTGLMEFGVRDSKPALTIQAGIGLGLAIDLGIASGSASVTIAFQLDINGNTITLMAILSGQASVDVLDGLASASLTLTAALGFSLSPIVPQLTFTPPLPPPPLPTEVTIGEETITLIATCSVGIHISICWVVSVSWDGSWEFSQSVTTPKLTVGI